MGMIKRYLRRTSARLLSKLGAPSGHSSGRLVLNEPPQEPMGKRASNQAVISLSKSNKRSKRHQQQVRQEALLAAAAKNHLPPVRFHQVHGPNARLSESRFVARRTQSFCHALVFSDRTIQPNERVYVKVLELAKGWSGTIRFGFTQLDPATLVYQMPKHACPDMTNAGHTWARALADEVVRRNSVIHFSYNPQGYIHYGINNQDCGVFQAGAQLAEAGQHLWFVVDIYGLTAAVELVDPRLHQRSRRSQLEGLQSPPATTMSKYTGAMDEVAQSHRVGRVKKRRKMRRGELLDSNQLYAGANWSPENLHLPRDTFRLHQGDQHLQQAQQLPNLSSVLLPATQQNIYSPMPQIASRRPVATASACREEPAHDYYQIMTSLRQANPSLLRTSASQPFLPAISQLPPSALDTSLTSDDSDQLDQLELRQRLENDLQLNENSNPMRTPIYKPSTLPTPATRRKLQRQAPKALNASISTSTSASSTPKTVSRPLCVSQKPTVVVAARDSSSQKESSPSKDCPICFERPINCVLYQCGHMCTCYECGVKQWRTQSRTCPICRTVIKDVIKTYMS